MGMGMNFMGVGWGGDGSDVHYGVTLFSLYGI